MTCIPQRRVTVHDILQMLDRVSPRGERQWVARCPAHEDRVASLSVSVGSDGRILLHCHAGCSVERVAAALGVTMSQLRGEARREAPPRREGNVTEVQPDRTWTIDQIRGWSSYVSHYMYETADGSPSYLVVRMRDRDGGKRFAQYHPVPGGWARGLAGTPRTLYHLPRILARIVAGVTVYIVEGEKDVHTLEDMGLVATSSSGGAGKWEQRYGAMFRGVAGVVILPDNDEPGRRHGAAILASVLAEGIPARMVELDVPEKGDVTDWVAAGGTREALEAIVEAAEPITAPEPGQDLGELNRTDVGNAARMVRWHGDRIRYCVGIGWLCWDGRRWRRDAEGAVVEIAKATARGILCEAAALEDQDQRSKLSAWALKSEAAGKIRAMVDLARSDPALVVHTGELDAQPWLMSCLNGTIDLRDGTLRPHDQADLITRIVPVEYDPAAVAPRWRSFLRELFDDGSRDDARIDALTEYLQRAIGYSVTGSTDEQVLWIMHGKGANGKSTLLEAIRETLGDYCLHASSSTFSAQKNTDRPRNDIARLHGARLVTTIELGEGRRLDEELVKQITGSDPVTCRFLFREEFSYVPEYHLWIAANHKPRISGTDHAIWRRIHLVPFSRTFVGDACDQRLAEALRSERGGILAWIVAGATAWHQRRLEPPAEVQAATREYREESDWMAEFLEDRCVVIPSARVDRSRLYHEYRQWMEGRGEKLLTATSFSRKIGDRDGIKRGKSGGSRLWIGLGLRGETVEGEEADAF